MTGRPVLYVVGCGARPSADLPEFAAWAMGQGWDTCAVLTPAALKFADQARLTEVTGHPARDNYKRPEDPDVLPPPDALAVAPCTFNTINKLAAGVSDTLALGLLNESLGAGRPIVAVPNPHVDLARHPAFGRNVELLRGWGVQVLFDPDKYELPNGSNDPGGIFPWDALKAEVAAMLGQVRLGQPRLPVPAVHIEPPRYS